MNGKNVHFRIMAMIFMDILMFDLSVILPIRHSILKAFPPLPFQISRTIFFKA
jgi:hypothetical protein